MSLKFTEEDMREIEKQLSCPSGPNGIEVGHKMNASNIGMTINSIDYLDLNGKDYVMELGHGNCGHLDLIFKVSDRIKYFGLELSETMWQEAQKINANRHAEFRLYDGQTIPFQDNCFNKMFTVNTVYFWPNPVALLNEIERILTSDGVFVLTFATPSFMKNMPFVGERFRLYDVTKVQKLVKESNLIISDIRHNSDKVELQKGDWVTRNYIMVKMKRGNVE